MPGTESSITVLMWGVTPPQGPTFKTRGSTGAMDEGDGGAAVLGCRHISQWDGVIYSWKHRGIRICHNSDISKDSPTCKGVLGVDGEGWTRIGVWDELEQSWTVEVLTDNNASKKTNKKTPKPDACPHLFISGE